MGTDWYVIVLRDPEKLFLFDNGSRIEKTVGPFKSYEAAEEAVRKMSIQDLSEYVSKHITKVVITGVRTSSDIESLLLGKIMEKKQSEVSQNEAQN